MRGPGIVLSLCAVLGVLGPGRGLRHAVHWNSSNPRFLKEDYTVRVAMNDYLDIYCPHYDIRVPMEDTENFVLYMVDRDGYEGCYTTPGDHVRWKCNRPHAPSGPITFSEKIQRFTPFSLGFEFHPGQDYYYISVPEEGSIGECLKLRLSVCCPPTAAPITQAPKSQPRGGEAGGGGRAPAQGDPHRQSRNSSSSRLLGASSSLLLHLLFLLLCF